jgi:hypothetical protein
LAVDDIVFFTPVPKLSETFLLTRHFLSSLYAYPTYINCLFLQARFKEEVEKRGGDFKDTVYSFGEEEGEVWALCRWLRARKFVYDDVITMVTEATKQRAEAKAKNFYPDPREALGCDISFYIANYPQLYTGVSKTGAPLFISKPGVLNVDAMECLTTIDGIVKFHWYAQMHDFKDRLRAQKLKDPAHFKK